MLFQPLFDLGPANITETFRSSSYDRSGGNVDFRRIMPNESITILEADGPGMVTHIWFALSHFDPNYLRRLVIKAWWDDEEKPSVDCPLGDFFGVGHGIANKYECAIVNMVRGDGMKGENTGANIYVPMPFSKNARIEVHNESHVPCAACYYQVEWLKTTAFSTETAGRFHAQWRRENPCRVANYGEFTKGAEQGRFARNLDGEANYRAIEIEGEGRFLGMNLSVDNIDPTYLDRNYVCCFNEGDEWIFIDDDEAVPRLHGTGTEDYFNDAWGMTGYAGLWAGTSLDEGRQREAGKRPKGTCYRFHIQDPVYFKKSLRFSFEHGHANHQANDLSSVCYWYQHEPHKEFILAPVETRMPLPDLGAPSIDEENKIASRLGWAANSFYDIFLSDDRRRVVKVGDSKLLGVVSQLKHRYTKGEVGLAEIDEELAPHEEWLKSI